MIEIHAGSGGEDSKLFSRDLMAAYVKWAESNRLSCEILDSERPCFLVSGNGAGELFRVESGSHCIQRIPPTESNGKRQTSYVMVAVLPLPPERSQVMLPESEIETTTMRGSGPGGQHRNKTESCVRMVHVPTGLHVTIDGRDQQSNRRDARRILSAKVSTLVNGDSQEEYDRFRKSQVGSGNRGDKIRTYNFIKSRAVDHRTGKKTNNVEQVIGKGRFDLLR